MRDPWDSADGALWAAGVAVLAGGWLVARLAPRADRWRALLAWLAFPPLLVTASSGSNDVLLAVLLAAALVTLRRHPVLSVLILGAACWVKLVPVPSGQGQEVDVRDARPVLALSAG